MLTLTFMFSASVMITGLIAILAVSLSEKSLQEREKLTPFECGFSPFKKARSSFSVRFFIITLIFLIFDIEIALLFPLSMLISTPNKSNLIIVSILVVIILTLGLLHEWKKGMLNWII